MKIINIIKYNKIKLFILSIILFFICVVLFKKNQITLFKKHKNQVANVGITLPKKLRSVPLAETQNIVLGTKKIKIRNVKSPYNASIIKYGHGYLMFFRYDINKKDQLCSYIGGVELDNEFNQTKKEFVTIQTKHDNSEDPRVFQIGNETYLSYSKVDFNKKYNFHFVNMNIANIDLETYTCKFITELEPNFSPIEKNWSPFEFVDDQGKPEIFFQYSFNSHKILNLPNPKISHLEHPIFEKDDIFQPLSWERKWGVIRGGTPALKIGDQYLGFFHSSFKARKQSWYIMGAYTFEAKPPFKITAISPYPIIFSGMYESPHISQTSDKHVIFPTGFVIEKKDNKELIHLSCGENDSTIKIITLDKEALLNSLENITWFKKNSNHD